MIFELKKANDVYHTVSLTSNKLSQAEGEEGLGVSGGPENFDL